MALNLLPLFLLADNTHTMSVTDDTADTADTVDTDFGTGARMYTATHRLSPRERNAFDKIYSECARAQVAKACSTLLADVICSVLSSAT